METTGIFFYETACTAPPHLNTEARITAAPTVPTARTHTRARLTATRTRPTRRTPRTLMPAMATEPATATGRRGATDTARSGMHFPIHHYTRAILIQTQFCAILNYWVGAILGKGIVYQ